MLLLVKQTPVNGNHASMPSSNSTMNGFGNHPHGVYDFQNSPRRQESAQPMLQSASWGAGVGGNVGNSFFLAVRKARGMLPGSFSYGRGTKRKSTCAPRTVSKRTYNGRGGGFNTGRQNARVELKDCI